MVSIVGGGICGCCLAARRKSSSAPTRGELTPNFDKRGDVEILVWQSAAIARRGSSMNEKSNRRRGGFKLMGVAGRAGLSGVVGDEDRFGVSGRAEVSIDSGAGRGLGEGR